MKLLPNRIKTLPNFTNQESVLKGVRQDIPVVHPDTPLMETVLLLLRSRIALPVVDKNTGRLVGMISSWGALEKL